MPTEESAHWVLTDVSLVIEREGLDPATLTDRLGLSPTNSACPGEDRSSDDPASGFWMLEYNERTTRIFSEQLDALIETLESRNDELRRMRSEGYRMRISVYGFSGNESKVSFSAHDMKRLAHLGIPVQLTPNMNDR